MAGSVAHTPGGFSPTCTSQKIEARNRGTSAWSHGPVATPVMPMTDGQDRSQGANDGSGRTGPRDRPVPEVTLVARVQEYDDRPDTCTILPVDVDDWTALTTWISAHDPGFVPLDEMR